ncbi:OadG-related small transporter subunit [Seramator thermalis]|jgi:hypothetical protein|uniref:OadG-related small transporter subunit n=1 Tax=Seramator thermalis TaxID=2496270 RepID=UPI00101B9F78|nr:OadG-related small transporter subunit [Seramator thermalis]MDN5295992.1 hypothetical protein [Bacteroidota bacterium]
MESSVLDKAFEIAGIGIIGVFVFMTVFYLIILGLDKFFPYEKQNSVGKSNIAVDNTDNDNED